MNNKKRKRNLTLINGDNELNENRTLIEVIPDDDEPLQSSPLFLSTPLPSLIHKQTPMKLPEEIVISDSEGIDNGKRKWKKRNKKNDENMNEIEIISEVPAHVNVNDNDKQLIAYNNCDLISDAPLHKLLPIPIRVTNEMKKLIQKNNIRIKSGKFTIEEDTVLTRNWLKYCEDIHMKNPATFLGFFSGQSKDDEKLKNQRSEAKAIIKETQMYLRLAKDLPERTLYSIYHRARKLFSQLQKGPDLSTRKKSEIMRLHKAFGDAWTKIAFQIQCDPKTANEIVKNAVDKKGKPYNKGIWDDDEDQKLIKVLKKILKKDDLSFATTDIPWQKVSEKLKTRSAAQCRHRWLLSLHWSLAKSHFETNNWDRRFDSARLIHFIFKNEYESEEQIDWDFLKEKFSAVASYDRLMRNWRKLKNKVPDYDAPFKDKVKWLWINKVHKHIRSDDDWDLINQFCES